MTERQRIEVSAAAKRLRVSEQHVRRLIEAHEIEAFDASRGKVSRWQVYVDSLEAFLRRRSTFHGERSSQTS